MKIIDYKQPDFYHFSEDSILFTKKVSTLFKTAHSNVLEICAGCGIIGSELSNLIEINKMTFIELQSEFEESLDSNLKNFCKAKSAKYIIGNFLDLNISETFDMIVFNPPFFELKEGRLPPDSRKQHCHFIKQMDFDLMLNKAFDLLNSSGIIYLLMRADSSLLKNTKLKFTLEMIEHFDSKNGVFRIVKN